jgi:hypothetical protein
VLFDSFTAEAECVGELLLRHRQLVALANTEPGFVKSERELAEHMGHPRQGIASANIERPFPEDRAVEQRVIPHCLACRRPREGDRANGVDRDEGHIACAQHLDIVIGLAELRIAEVDTVAGHVDRKYLARAGTRGLVPDREARKDDTAVLRLLVLAN